MNGLDQQAASDAPHLVHPHVITQAHSALANARASRVGGGRAPRTRRANAAASESRKGAHRAAHAHHRARHGVAWDALAVGSARLAHRVQRARFAYAIFVVLVHSAADAPACAGAHSRRQATAVCNRLGAHACCEERWRAASAVSNDIRCVSICASRARCAVKRRVDGQRSEAAHAAEGAGQQLAVHPRLGPSCRACDSLQRGIVYRHGGHLAAVESTALLERDQTALARAVLNAGAARRTHGAQKTRV